jgi:hypothetical protein
MLGTAPKKQRATANDRDNGQACAQTFSPVRPVDNGP